MPVDTFRQRRRRAKGAPSYSCRSNLRRPGDARPPWLHRDDFASDAGLLERCVGHRGQIRSLVAVAGAPEGRSDIKAAARWRPTTGAYVSGTDPDRGPARAPCRPARPPDHPPVRLRSRLSARGGPAALRPLRSSRPAPGDPGAARRTWNCLCHAGARRGGTDGPDGNPWVGGRTVSRAPGEDLDNFSTA